MKTTTDSIRKETLLRAPRSRVWRALTDSAEFGSWFGAKVEGTFRPKQRVMATVTGCGHEGLRMELFIERIQPENLFSYRWHPYAVEPDTDYSSEATTLVEFRLEEVAEGTRLVVIESGFDQLPPERRDLAFRMNDGGWTAQIQNIERYVGARQ